MLCRWEILNDGQDVPKWPWAANVAAITVVVTVAVTAVTNIWNRSETEMQMNEVRMKCDSSTEEHFDHLQ